MIWMCIVLTIKLERCTYFCKPMINLIKLDNLSMTKKTDTYTLKTNRKGEARTRIDNVEKSILSDGMNFMTNDNMWTIGGAGQPTVEGF